MSGENIYLLSFLPSLDHLGQEPPLSCAEFLRQLDDESGLGPLRRLAEAVVLSDDLLQRDAQLAGQAEPPSPNVLTVEQVRDEMPLPDELVPTETVSPRIAADAVWSAYFRYAAELARQSRSRFLTAWVGFEVALRNAVAETRARALGLEPNDYLVAEDLETFRENFTPTVNEWSAAANPLAAQRVLDSARWQWLSDNDTYFSFGDDELLAYAAKLMLTERWYRLSQAIEQQEESKT